MCNSWITLYYCDILIFFSVSVILYLFAGGSGSKCRLTTFPTWFAYDVSTMCYCHCSDLM